MRGSSYLRRRLSLLDSMIELQLPDNCFVSCFWA